MSATRKARPARRGDRRARPGRHCRARNPCARGRPANAPFKARARQRRSNRGYLISNNMATTAAAGSQTIWAFSYRNWGVESTQPPTPGIKSYPSLPAVLRSRDILQTPLHAERFHANVDAAPGRTRPRNTESGWITVRSRSPIQVNNHGLPPVGHRSARPPTTWRTSMSGRPARTISSSGWQARRWSRARFIC